MEGNTVSPIASSSKQETRRKFYCFTLFGYENIEQAVQDRLIGICDKALYGKETCPETGRKHLQGFMQLKRAMRKTELKIPGNPHLKACRGNEEQNEEYCSKDGIVWKHGYPKPIKIIETLRPWQKEIEDLCLTEPDDRTINWYWEEHGNIGKSAFCKYMFVKHGAQFCSGGKISDIMNLVFNTDMDKCRVIIFDIPRANRGHISYASLEAIKNGLVCNTKYETGAKAFNPPHVIVFANFPPESPEMLSEDRWNIVEL